MHRVRRGDRAGGLGFSEEMVDCHHYSGMRRLILSMVSKRATSGALISASSAARVDARIDRFIESGHWEDAKRLLSERLKREPEEHYYWAKISGVHYMMGKYAEALDSSERALCLAPRCSLAVWEYAEAAFKLARYQDAVNAYRRITTRGIDGVMREMHHEGRAWTRGLVADSFFRLSWSYLELGKRRMALRAAKAALELRGHGVKTTLYPIAQLHYLLGLLED